MARKYLVISGAVNIRDHSLYIFSYFASTELVRYMRMQFLLYLHVFGLAYTVITLIETFSCLVI